jgi:hypothetical protein
MEQHGLVTLTWYRDSKGYEIQDAPRKSCPLARAIADFPPYSDAYAALAPYGGPDRYVVGKGGLIETYSLYLGEKDAYLALANLQPRFAMARVLDFVDQWGPLTEDRTLPPEKASVGTPISLYYQFSSLVRSIITDPAGEARLLEFEAALRGGWPLFRPRLTRKPGQPRLATQWHLLGPLSLFIVMQVVQDLNGGVEIVECPTCCSLRSKANRGPTPKYCKIKGASCKQKAYRERKALKERPAEVPRG